MNKPNSYFNDAWGLLSNYHEEHKNFGTKALSFDSPPRFKTLLEYSQYIDALFTTVKIGIREKYIDFHQNGRGSLIHIVIRKD